MLRFPGVRPGRIPDSVKTWKPLQIPSKGFRAARNSSSCCAQAGHQHGGKYAARSQVVAVRETAGDDRRLVVAEPRAAVQQIPQQHKFESVPPANSIAAAVSSWQLVPGL